MYRLNLMLLNNNTKKLQMFILPLESTAAYDPVDKILKTRTNSIENNYLRRCYGVTLLNRVRCILLGKDYR